MHSKFVLVFVITITRSILLFSNTGGGVEGRRIPQKRSRTSEYVEDDDETGRVSLGSFETYAHELGGDVSLLDEKTMEISGLTYDGTGPAAWFMLGKTSRSRLPEFIELEGTVIPDEDEDCETLKRYNGDDVTLKLPGKMKFSDYNYISMYCVRFNHNFGYVMIPDNMKLKNGTVPKGMKACDQDDLDEAGDSRPVRPNRPRPGPPPPPPPSTGFIGGLINRVSDVLG